MNEGPLTPGLVEEDRRGQQFRGDRVADQGLDTGGIRRRAANIEFSGHSHSVPGADAASVGRMYAQRGKCAYKAHGRRRPAQVVFVGDQTAETDLAGRCGRVGLTGRAGLLPTI